MISAPLLRIVLGREWKAYAAWSLGSACVLRFCAGSFPSLYPTAEARRNVAATFRIPVAKVFGGAGYGLDGPNPRIGAILATRPLLFCLLLAAFMATVTVLRRTRGDEERRSSELVRSTAVGRLEPAVCSLASAAIGSACAGAACAAAAIAGGLEAADSLAMGAGIAMVGLCSASSALVVTAVAPSARGATAGGMTLLLVWFSIRGLALMRESAGFLSWATPFGLAQEMRPWAGVRWGPFAVGVAAAAAVGALGLLLHSGRQWGAGRFGAFLSAGRGRARSGPNGLVATAMGATRGMRRWWLACGLAFGLLYGALTVGIRDSLDAVPSLFEGRLLMAKLAESGLTVENFLKAILVYGGYMVGACAVSIALAGLRDEESGRLGRLLAAPVGRGRWMAAQAAAVLAGSGALVVAAVAGLVATTIPVVLVDKLPEASDPWGLAWRVALAAAALWPAALLHGGVVFAAHGWMPRAARAVSWGVLVAALLLAVSSMLVDVPRWLAGLSPYAHQPDVLGAETAGGTWTGPAVCLALAAILTFVGARGLSRRDLMA